MGFPYKRGDFGANLGQPTRRRLISLSASAATALHIINDIALSGVNFTIFFWQKPAAEDGRTIWASNTGKYQIYNGSTGRRVRGRFNSRDTANGTDYLINTWHQHCFTFGFDHDGNRDLRTYLDGVSHLEITNGAANGEIYSSGTHYILGDDNAGADSDDGYLGEIFDFVLIYGIHPPGSRISNFRDGRWVDLPNEAYDQIIYRLDGQHPSDPGWDSGPRGNHFLQEDASTPGITMSLLDLPPGANVPQVFPIPFFPAAATGGQTLIPGLMATEESFLSPTVTVGAVSLTPGLMVSEEQFFAPSVIPIIAPGLMATEEQFFGPTVSAGAVDLTPGLGASEETFFAATVTQEAQTLEPGLMASEEVFFDPTVAAGAVGLTPGLMASEEQFFGPALTAGAVDLAPSLVASEEGFFAATVTQDAQILEPDFMASEEVFFDPTVAAGAVGLTPGIMASEEAFFGPSVGHGITASFMASEEQFFGPTVAVGVATLTPSLMVSEEQFFSPTIAGGSVTLTPPLMAPEEQFFAPSVIPIIAPGLLTSEEQFFGPSVVVGAVTLLPGFLASEEAFFAATVARTEIFHSSRAPTTARRAATTIARRASTTNARR